jgi:cytochrome c oxidase cbb3-type subunit 2
VLLRRLFPAGQIGVHAGLGTGLAYLVCNVPWLFEAPPVAKGIFACATLSLGALSTLWLSDAAVPESPAPPEQAEPLLSRPASFALITGMFLALIWLDSAAFYIIQNTPHLKAASWGGPASQLRNGLIHLAAALVGGWLIDRGKLHAALILAYLIITSGILLLQRQGSPAPFSATFYVVAVSVYSTALSAYPALEPEGKGAVPIRWRAGVLYAISGWLGSALGVGMAQTLRVVPTWFMAAAGLVMGPALVSMVLRGRGRRGSP